ncbi:Trans-aconitate 2-methyltransferase [bioreactor metagenome]|uniref:Trans-aconitate 2-methyltransferase n=1 Tax=bioreactor metagenome TaxID=1076179 RepID=A0A644ZI48_9ZZZZ
MKNLIKKYSNKNDNILDVGCGEGYLTRMIFNLKRKAYGCDISPEMITAAKKQNEKIDYWIQDIEQKNSNFKKPKFKIIISNLVFTYLKNTNQTLKNIYNYLDQDGILIIAIPHPCFYHQENYLWFMDETINQYHFGNYFNEKTFIKEIFNGFKTHYIHRKLETYFSTFIKNNFNLISFLEPKPKKVSTNILKRVNQIPNIAFFVLQKKTV